uniref:Uncharacterized protein n=1 Tax=Tetraselmis sp. GSL018 TaxID=582737 RepID=A0A061QGF8_9CHLO
MLELRRLWKILDQNGILLQAQYIASEMNKDADHLSRVVDIEDWQLHPKHFRFLDNIWGRHTIDRFASMNNAQTHRFNSKWWDPESEGIDSLQMPHEEWRKENNWCNPPWTLLPSLIQKLKRSGAAATVIAPIWRQKPWFPELENLAEECILFPPSRSLFFPGRQGRREGVGLPGWSVGAFRVPFRAGPTSGERAA